MSADIVRKSVTAQIVDSGSADDPFPGTFEAVLATADSDREGETATKSEWQLPLPDSIPINPDHTMDNVLLTMGSATPELQEDGTLLIKGRYAATDDAQKLRSLVNDKHVTGMSVEFMRKRTPSNAKGGAPTYTVSRELIGGAFTNYPINTHARVLTSKAGARNSKSDAANIQAVHDASMALGADCGAQTEKSLKVSVKADYGDSAMNLLTGVDAAIDSALELITDYDVTQLPPVIQQFIANVVAADATMDKFMAMAGIADPDEQSGFDDGSKSLTTKAISDKPWSDFSQADYSIEQWRKACVVHPDAPSDSKDDYKLPIREPNGDLNSNAVHAAAGRVHELQGASKAQAAKALISAYGQLKEDPPPALSQLAGDSSSDSAAKSAANAVDSVAEEKAKLDLQTSSYKFKSALAHALLAKSL